MVYIFYCHRKILKDKDLTFTCRNEKGRTDFSILP